MLCEALLCFAIVIAIVVDLAVIVAAVSLLSYSKSIVLLLRYYCIVTQSDPISRDRRAPLSPNGIGPTAMSHNLN